MSNELPRPEWMSKKDREYLQRLMTRKGTLDIRWRGSQLRDKQEIEKERNALEWAIERLSTRPEVERIEPDGITRKMQHINSETVYVCPAREEGKYECWRYTDGWKLIESRGPQGESK